MKIDYTKKMAGFTIYLLKAMRRKLGESDFNLFCLRMFGMAGVEKDDEIEFLAYIHKQIDDKEKKKK